MKTPELESRVCLCCGASEWEYLDAILENPEGEKYDAVLLLCVHCRIEKGMCHGRQN